MNLETMIANALARARMTIDDFTVSEPDKYGKVVVVGRHRQQKAEECLSGCLPFAAQGLRCRVLYLRH